MSVRRPFRIPSRTWRLPPLPCHTTGSSCPNDRPSGAYAQVMDVLARLAEDRTVDITTTGARSGKPRRIETWTWIAEGTVYLTGSPGRRDWYANLKANPELVLHLKRGEPIDLPARARP